MSPPIGIEVPGWGKEGVGSEEILHSSIFKVGENALVKNRSVLSVVIAALGTCEVSKGMLVGVLLNA